MGRTLGPELEFGQILGYYHDEMVLIIEAAQGNRCLGWGILCLVGEALGQAMVNLLKGKK